MGDDVSKGECVEEESECMRMHMKKREGLCFFFFKQKAAYEVTV